MSRRDLMKTAAVPEEFRRVDPKEVHKIVDASGKSFEARTMGVPLLLRLTL
jgi:hypothetical protein